MKVLITEGTTYYLVDLEKTKPKTLREVLLETDGSEVFTINLANQDITDLDQLLGEAIAARTRLVAPPTAPVRTRTTTAKTDGPSAGEVRAWCAEQGIEVNPKGRISAEIQEKYDQAHK